MTAMPDLTFFDLLALSVGAIGFGMYLLIKGGGAVVDAAIFIAKKSGVPAMVVGFTIVAFGTSLPELLVSVNANLKGFGGISVGNIVGSNIANILLILGVSAIISPLIAGRHACTRDLLVMLGATAVLVLAMMTGLIVRWQGAIMFAALIGYVLFQYYEARKNKEPVPEEVEEANFDSMGKCIAALLLGLIGLAIGAELLVRGTVTSATALGVPESVVALTVVAFGTSLPELATCILSVKRNEHDLVFGNIIGSNVFNILSIVGLTAMLKPIAIESHLLGPSMWIMVATAVLFSGWMMIFHRLPRALGYAMCLAYLAFVASEYLLSKSPVL